MRTQKHYENKITMKLSEGIFKCLENVSRLAENRKKTLESSSPHTIGAYINRYSYVTR